MLYSKTVVNNIDYEDIYDNINDYEYPYNHINREEVKILIRLIRLISLFLIIKLNIKDID